MVPRRPHREFQWRPLTGRPGESLDKNNTLLFDVLTDASGDIETQDVLEYTRTGSSQTFYTPISWRRQRPVMYLDTRQLSLTGNRSLTVMLQPVASNAAPIAEAGPD